MQYQKGTLEVRLNSHIKDYDFHRLYEKDKVCSMAAAICDALNLEMLLTDRKGKTVYLCGNMAENPDVDKNAGIKIRVYDRTIAHLYVDYTNSSVEEKKAEAVVQNFADMLVSLGNELYFHKEAGMYIDDHHKSKTVQSDKEDALTGVMSQSYFEHRMQIIDRSEVVPVAAIVFNINDWKVANDNFGDEESDRLIATIADIIKENAKPEYIIGRVDGDVFNVIIPMPEDDEAEEYSKVVQYACDTFEDEHLAPSVACGVAYKTNVETSMESAFSDAEVEMLENKISIKNSKEYCNRLKKKL